MTAVVGLVHDGRVYMGADSGALDGYALVVRSDPKVFHVGPYLMAFCGSYRMGQILRYELDAPVPSGDLDRFMVKTFVGAVRQSLKDGGVARREEEQELGGRFLVGVKGRLFLIDGDYHVGESASGFMAAGAGRDLAHGAMYATAGQPPRPRILTALQAAEQFSGGVRGPFTILSAR